jgi:glucokinase
MPMLLAGDIGGTKTLLGLFERAPRRPRPRTTRAFATLDFDGLGSMVNAFLEHERIERGSIEAACFGVAGPVLGDAAELTNVPWRVDAGAMATEFGLPRVHLLNDLQAMAYAVPVLEAAELVTIQEGHAVPTGNLSLIAAGTGLGEALLHQVDGRFIPSPSEGGHADYAPRNEREIAVMRDLTLRRGRAEVEDVISGPGLVNIHRVVHQEACTASIDIDDPGAPAAISTAALEGACAGCVATLDLFIDAYGAEAGNLALRMVSTGGVFVGGGIAPKILPALTDGRFLRAFRQKPPLDAMLADIPVKIILNAQAGLLGAAVFAGRDSRRQATKDTNA